jgi:TPR repeat protein
LALAGCYESGVCLRVDPPPERLGRLYQASLENNKEKALALVRYYEYTGDPETLSTLAAIYARGAGEFESEELRDQKIVEYLKKAALCGDGRALLLIGEAYHEGKYGLEPYPEMAQCLARTRKADRKAVDCRLTLDEARMPEPSEVPFPRGEAYGDIRCESSPDGWASDPSECSSP